MRLTDALRVEPGYVIAFSGAGGKSTAIGKLTVELAEDHAVVVTTSTKLHRDQSSLAQHHLILRGSKGLKALSDLVREHRSVLITGEIEEDEPKWQGLSLSCLDEIKRFTQDINAVLLVEADGARGLSLKAPAEHEPVIPDFVDLVVPVVGLDVIGQPLSEEWVHRSEVAGPLMQLDRGERIEAQHVAALLSDAQGGMKGVPSGAVVRGLLNKAESTEGLENGREIAAHLTHSSGLEAVIVGCAAHDPPVREVIGRIGGIVLAAGGSSRLGQAKQLLPWRGRPLVWHAVQAALEGGLSPVVVVLGYESDGVRRTLVGEPVTFIDNPEWSLGQSTSLKAGLAAVEEGTEAVVILLSDTPNVNADLVRALKNKHRSTLSPLVAPMVDSHRANPVLFDRSTFTDLHNVVGDQGGRSLFAHYRTEWVQWDSSILFDVDTVDDLKRLEGDG
jgi:molybdenum cofactor cytidylyltransferase